MKKIRATARFFTVFLAVLAAGSISYNAASSAQAIAKKWVKRYDATGYREDPNDYANAVVVDGSGNIYVTGVSAGSNTGQDFATIKYSGVGKQLWVKRYNGPGNGSDAANAIAVDSSGNIYVTGASAGKSTGQDYATVKYSSAGKQLWVKRYTAPGNGDDCADAIAMDRSGNIYVTGYSKGSGTDEDYATVKYSSAGKELWVKRYNGPGNGEDFANAIAVDGSENICVTGRSARSGADDDFATIKYSSAGKELWLKRYNGPKNGNDHPLAIAVDGSGNIYVTGYSWAGEIWESGTGNDYATIKYSSAGKQLWVKRYDGPGNREDYARAIAVDGSGNIYVTGSSTGSDFESDISDYVTIKYSGAGVQLWLDRYDGPGGWGENDDGANAIAVDKSGNVYVTGYSTGSDTGYDYATIKY
jgi:uncharacterized delta-60 repeat protein